MRQWETLFVWICLLFPVVSFSAQLSDIPDNQSVRIGVYIGTYDPPHEGHRIVAEAVAAAGLVDFVLFLANDNAHHKPNATPFFLRKRMTELMAEDSKVMVVPEYVPHPTKFYTETALLEVQRRFPKARFFGMMGTDVAARMDEIYPDQKYWMGRMEAFIVNEREGHGEMKYEAEVDGKKMISFTAHEGGHSSTAIRELVKAQGGSVPLSPKIKALISEYHLWQPQASCRILFM